MCILSVNKNPNFCGIPALFAEVNIFHRLPRTCVYGLLFITENTISGMACQAMLESGSCGDS
jgi:hypothetical protein